MEEESLVVLAMAVERWAGELTAAVTKGVVVAM